MLRCMGDVAARALDRLGTFATENALPFAQSTVEAARDGIEALTIKALGRDFEERLRRLPSDVDPFGLDPEWTRRAIIVAALFHRLYFRTIVKGIERVPTSRALLVANHSGQIPMDGVIIAASLFLDAKPPRIVRSMVEKWTQTLPFVSTFFSRVGQVVGVPENARRLLAQGEPLLVFPEGARGISKSFSQRYRLADFGLGFMRLALETNTPIVPVALIGAEEQYVSLGNLDRVARLMRMPSFPILPQLLVPGGQLPLPTRYRLTFGEPMVFDGDPDDDDTVIEEKVLRVKSTIQSMLHRGLKERTSIFR